MDYPTESDYEDCLCKFEVLCEPCHEFVEHVKNTWLMPHKENFLKAWTNKVMHSGNTTTNKYLTYNSLSIK